MKKLLVTLLTLTVFLTGCTKNVPDEKLDVKEVSLIDDAMTYDDLYVNVGDAKVEIGMSVDEVKEQLGIPMSEIDTSKDPNAWREKGNLYGDEIILDYDGLNFVYYKYDDEYKLSNIIIRKSDVLGPRGIKIGMTEEEAKSKFPQNEDVKYLCNEGEVEAWGMQIYGDLIANDFQNVAIQSDAQIGYEICPYEENDEYCAVYEYWKLNDEERLNQLSENAAIIIYMQKGIVTSINIEFNPSRV